MIEREAGIERLYPSIFGRMATRYYYLRQLRQQIEEVIHKFVANSPQKLVLTRDCGKWYAAHLDQAVRRRKPFVL